MTVAIVTDSTSSLSAAIAKTADITVVPLQVIIGAETHTEGVDVTAAMLAEALENFVPVSTSRPTPEAFRAAYESAAADGATEVVSVHLSAKVSATFDSARVAAKESVIPVHLVDTEQVGIATGFAALQAARVRDTDATADEVAEVARRCGQESVTYFYVDTLEYLRRGGRVGAASALIGSALAVKPILTVSDGVIAPLEKVRTTTKALARVEALVRDHVAGLEAGYAIGVQHLASPQVAQSVAGRLASTLGRDEIDVQEVGASIGAHVGPGMIAVTLTPTA